MARKSRAEARATVAKAFHTQVTGVVDETQPVRGEIVEYTPAQGDQPGTATIVNPQPMNAMVQEASTKERERQALILKMGGASYASIAKQVGYANASVAHAAVKRAMAGIVTPDATLMRDIQTARLEHMILLLWPDVNRKDLPSMMMVRALISDIRHMHGLDEPEKFEVQQEVADGVLRIGGDKEDYMGTMRRVRAALKAGSSPTEESSNGEADSEND